jgi:hypothetical protein
MVESEIHIHVDLEDPTIIVQSFFDIPTLPSGDFVDGPVGKYRLAWHRLAMARPKRVSFLHFRK